MLKVRDSSHGLNPAHSVPFCPPKCLFWSPQPPQPFGFRFRGLAARGPRARCLDFGATTQEL
jgi:hypothetical protein